jgi:ketosteroid isomerase-like protein
VIKRPADIITELYQAFRAGDLPTVERLLADDVVFHGSQGHEFGGTIRGRDAFFETYQRMMARLIAFDTETQAIAGDDTVAFGHNRIIVTRLDGSQVAFDNVTSFRFNAQGQISEAFEATTANWDDIFR